MASAPVSMAFTCTWMDSRSEITRSLQAACCVTQIESASCEQLWNTTAVMPSVSIVFTFAAIRTADDNTHSNTAVCALTAPPPTRQAVRQFVLFVAACYVPPHVRRHTRARTCKHAYHNSIIIMCVRKPTCSRILGLSALLHRSRAASISLNRCALRSGSGGVTQGDSLEPSSSRHADDCRAAPEGRGGGGGESVYTGPVQQLVQRARCQQQTI